MDQTTKAYVILGASGGIGSDLCRRLAKSGHRLLLAGRNPAKLEELAREIDSEFLAVEASSTSEVEACARKAVELFGQLNGVVNCAGSLLLKPAHLTNDAEWSATLANNLTSAFAAVRAAALTIKEPGSVVLVSSAAARIGLANHEAIAAAKAGVIGLTLAAAASYAARGLRVNCVAPGMVRTPLTARLLASDLMVKGSNAMHALGRIGEPTDVSSAIEWLLNAEQSWVTGQVIAVDGGLSSLRTRSA